ncbi:MAG: hypothetical protein V2I43_06480 [Parvularcula sp.]|jgi:hypothetical protein|nr:hypothetical protein [Parvularcula sp.]
MQPPCGVEFDPKSRMGIFAAAADFTRCSRTTETGSQAARQDRLNSELPYASLVRTSLPLIQDWGQLPSESVPLRL